MIVWAWAARNRRQFGPAREGAGSMPVSWGIAHTVDGAAGYSTPTSSYECEGGETPGHRTKPGFRAGQGPVGFVAMQPPTDTPPIPYAGHHAGPRRVLVLNLRRGLIAGSSVTINIDGNEYPQRWGRTAFEIPEDRPVAVAVFQQFRGGQAGLATTVLVPGVPPELEYRGPAHLAMAGELGLPGTVRQRGLVMQLVLFGCLGVVLLFIVLFLVFIVASL